MGHTSPTSRSACHHKLAGLKFGPASLLRRSKKRPGAAEAEPVWRSAGLLDRGVVAHVGNQRAGGHQVREDDTALSGVPTRALQDAHLHPSRVMVSTVRPS